MDKPWEEFKSEPSGDSKPWESFASQKPKETSLGEKAYGAVRGPVTRIASYPGEIESALPSPKIGDSEFNVLGYPVDAKTAMLALTPGGLPQAAYLKAKQQLGRESILPTQEEVSKGLTKVGLPPSKATTTEKYASYAPDIYGLYGLGKLGVEGATGLAKKFLL